MRKFRLLRGIGLFVMALMLSGCGEDYEFHQKTVIEVEMPDGSIKTGGSVVEVRWHIFGKLERSLGAANAASSRISGEAAFVELGEGRVLFALVGGAKTLVPRTFFKRKKQGWEYAGPILQSSSHKGDIRPKDYPRLVTFTDISDPSSVKKVEPHDLASHFGPGGALKRITLEITDEPVTRGRVEKVLGWLGPHPETPLLSTINPHNFSFAAKMRQGSFIRR